MLEKRKGIFISISMTVKIQLCKVNCFTQGRTAAQKNAGPELMPSFFMRWCDPQLTKPGEIFRCFFTHQIQFYADTKLLTLAESKTKLKRIFYDFIQWQRMLNA